LFLDIGVRLISVLPESKHWFLDFMYLPFLVFSERNGEKLSLLPSLKLYAIESLIYKKIKFRNLQNKQS